MDDIDKNAIPTPHSKPKLSATFIFLVVAGILLGTIIAYFSINTSRALKRKACRARTSSMGYFASKYVNDHGGYLPPADKWADIISSEYNLDPSLFVCPSAKGDKCTYAININVAGKKLSEIPKDTVLFFEIESGSNIFGGPELLVARHGVTLFDNEACIVFANGHPELVRAEDFDKLRWKIEE